MFTTLLPLAFLALSTAQPIIDERQTKYYGVSLNLNSKPINEQPVYGRAPTELNKLSVHNFTVSQILFDPGVAVNVDINDVQCQAYSDVDGVVPLGAPFTNAKPAVFAAEGEPLVTFNSILCYVVGK